MHAGLPTSSRPTDALDATSGVSRDAACGLEPAAVLVIGASTGGPQALEIVLAGLSRGLDRTAVLVVLHMPSAFVQIVAQHVGRLTNRPTHVADHRSRIEAGHIYLSPGDVHLEVKRYKTGLVATHSSAPAENYCRPSVDVLFRSAAHVFGSRTLALVLSGMGQDGLGGADVVVRSGGQVVVQDERTSVVWGMPGAIAAAGLAIAVLPVEAIAGRLHGMLRKIGGVDVPA